jgi:hypothetical protein
VLLVVIKITDPLGKEKKKQRQIEKAKGHMHEFCLSSKRQGCVMDERPYAVCNPPM